MRLCAPTNRISVGSLGGVCGSSAVGSTTNKSCHERAANEPVESFLEASIRRNVQLLPPYPPTREIDAVRVVHEPEEKHFPLGGGGRENVYSAWEVLAVHPPSTARVEFVSHLLAEKALHELHLRRMEREREARKDNRPNSKPPTPPLTFKASACMERVSPQSRVVYAAVDGALGRPTQSPLPLKAGPGHPLLCFALCSVLLDFLFTFLHHCYTFFIDINIKMENN
eukprot:gene4866-3487_t